MQLEENSIIIEKNKDRYALQPALRFNKFNNAWKKTPFKELVKINQGLQIPISDRLLEKEKDALFYITNEFLKKNSKVTYYIKNASQSVSCLESDILMTRTGNTGMVVTNVSGAFHNNFFKIKYPDYIDKDFLVYFLRLPKTQNKILRLAGTSTIPDLNHSDFYKIYFKFPSFEEQQKIASFLSAVDKRIDLLEQKKAKLKKYKKGVMQKIFSREIRFKDENGKEFSDWKLKELGEI
ncbi:restriction endonuclease subunit S [uncultured Christiangramia sp.]|uniref:restriction endonuclease subunit S n=1 Tax=uncultured Christiangramia sp. TaxID=503836 RepID=UPI0026269B0E|nr:restriction endonuclease subunit S [uncultured Christiangramia sp.]